MKIVLDFRLSETFKCYEMMHSLDEPFMKGGSDITKPPPQFNRSNENSVVNQLSSASNSTNVNGAGTNSTFACLG